MFSLSRAFYLFTSFNMVLTNVEFVLLHTNDHHARVEQTDKYSNACQEQEEIDGVCFGGVSRRYTLIKEVRRNYSNVLLLDAGDQFQGTLWFQHYRGWEVAHYLEWMGYDAMTLGNHEFDTGVEGLVNPFLANATFPVLSSNIVSQVEHEFVSLFNKSVVLERFGTQIGIVGCTVAETPLLVDPDHVTTITFLDEITSVREEVNKLKAQGVKIIIALTHQGLAFDRKMALAIDDIDIIVGGHTHTFLYTGDKPSNEEPEGIYPIVVDRSPSPPALVVTAYAYGKYLGLLNIEFDDNGDLVDYSGNPVLLDDSIPQDPAMLADVEALSQPVREMSNEEVGDSYVLLNATDCRKQECTAGSMVAEAISHRQLRRPLTGDGWSDSSFTVWNGGGVRSTIEQGTVTVGEILTMLPFNNEIVQVTIDGKYVYEMFENSASRVEDNAGRFLQVSGVRVQYDLSRPVNQRVKALSVLCADCSIPKYEEVITGQNYSFFTNHYMTKGGDGYSMLLEHRLALQLIGNLESEDVISYFQTRSPVTTPNDYRIDIIVPTTTPPTTCTGCSTNHSPEGILFLWIMFITFHVFGH